MNRPDRRRPRLVEPLEARDLPSVTPFIAGLNRPRVGSVTSAELPTAPPIPTPHELARQAFVAKLAGRFTAGPGRLTDQAGQVFVLAEGNTSGFLHGTLQMALFLPRDPARPPTGTAWIYDRNVSNTGNLLALDLEGDPSAVSHGLPTVLTWTVNGNSGGAFVGATGSGTVEVHYAPGGKLPGRASGAGKAWAIFRGDVSTTGLNILRPG